MAEEVQTGGTKTFSYPKGYQPKLSEEQKKEIEDGYRKAEERKQRERKNRIIGYIIAALIAIAIVATYLLTK